MLTESLTQGLAQGVLHQLVAVLLDPVILLLMLVSIVAVADLGMLLGERFGGLTLSLKKLGVMPLEYRMKKRIERSDFVTRLGPMLGLMGTLIPLGPGLAALGQGNFMQLTQAITVAFDTTVLGLLIGMLGFVSGRLRRRWYERLLDEQELKESAGDGL